MNKIINIQPFRIKRMANNHDAFRIASALMAVEDQIEKLEQEHQKSVVGDFIDGQSDCKDGIPHQSGKSENYDRGYSAQYQLDQMNTERTSGEDR